MDKKPKARGPTKKAAKPKAKDEKQFERFIETARELDVDESGKSFDVAFRKIATPTVRTKSKSPTGS
ncbi:hypothetical protein [Rhodopseudomonas palustris]|uniref:hypothetical protein n=1 Tax=Rhodopseudomonas palustris TaxID=1076 RepID=UPI0012EE4F11|nr:hypothetical protein [Rhodopseudomonas palustris]